MPSRVRLRRRLLVFSAPVAVVMLLAVIKMISIVVAGNSSVSHFSGGDVEALRGDVAALRVVNVIEPAKAPFAAGDLAVLEDRLEEADAWFSDALSRTDATQSCPARINLELIRETQGDRAARDGKVAEAQERYTSALTVLKDAPKGCFEGNTDPDPERQAIRDSAAPRLAEKMKALHAPQAPPPPEMPPAPPPPPPPPPPPVAVDAAPPTPEQQLRLNPGAGDPIERLRQILEDAAASRNIGDNWRAFS